MSISPSSKNQQKETIDDFVGREKFVTKGDHGYMVILYI